MNIAKINWDKGCSTPDYYPFGMAEPGRSFSLSNDTAFHYGFNGKYKDNDIEGNGNALDFGARIYDSRLGKFLSIDPLFKRYPYCSPYAFAGDNPITLIDYNGEGPEKPIKIADVRKQLNDGKQAIRYQFTIFVEQPNPGTDDHIVLPHDVGHTYIQITKYNTDGSKTSVTFGYYPNNHNNLKEGGNPIKPEAKSTFGDDSKTQWHESVAKDISAADVNNVLVLATAFEQKDYNLNTCNCTDFGLAAADKVGIKITDTKGNWILGSGNDPADIGQAILAGSVTNTATGSKKGLTISVSQAAQKVLLGRDEMKASGGPK